MQPRPIVLLIATILAHPAAAQIFYNEARDKKAQEAESAAKQIAAGALFEKELRNADALGKLQIEGQLNLARAEWLNQIDAFTTWKDVADLLAGVKLKLAQPSPITPEERQARLVRLREKQKTLKALIASLKKPEHAGTGVEAILDHLDQGESLLKFAESFVPSGNPSASAAFDRVESALNIVQSLLESWKSAAGGVRAIESGLANLAIPPEVLEVELLRLEERYLAQIGIIAAREELEAGEVRALIEQAQAQMTTAHVAASDEIGATLRAEKDRDRLFFQLHVLHTAAAVAARNRLPEYLARLRETQEALRHTIRQDAATARSYEQLLLASSQRLALYHKGGIKAGQLAQLLYSISGLVSLPVIAAK